MTILYSMSIIILWVLRVSGLYIGNIALIIIVSADVTGITEEICMNSFISIWILFNSNGLKAGRESGYGSQCIPWKNNDVNIWMGLSAEYSQKGAQNFHIFTAQMLCEMEYVDNIVYQYSHLLGLKPHEEISIAQTLPGVLGPVSISNKTSYDNISQSHEASRFEFRIVQSRVCEITG